MDPNPDQTDCDDLPSKAARQRRSAVDTVVLVASIMGVGHFAVSLLLWLGLVRLALSLGDDVEWGHFLYATPTVVLLPLYLMCAILAWRRGKAARVLSTVAIALSVGFFIFDATNRNYQVHAEHYHGQGTAKTFHYYNWWWYDESWVD